MCAGDDKSGMRDGLTLLGYNYNCRTNKCDCLRGNKWDDLESTVHKASSDNWACYTSDAAGSMHSNSDDFDRGYSQGQQKAQNIWKYKGGSNCKNIADFEDRVDDYIKTHYWWYSSDSGSKISFDKGAQAGMKQVLKQYETQCDHDDHVDVEMCSNLGKDAASEIAEEYAAKHCGGNCLFSVSHNKYKEECYKIGLDDCKGAIGDKLNYYCHGYIDHFNVVVGLLELKCKSKVGSYIIDHSLD